MEKAVLLKLKQQIKLVRKDKPLFFGFSPKVTVGTAKPEPLLIIDKMMAVKAGDFLRRAKMNLGIVAAKAEGGIMCGTVKRGRVGLLFEVNPKISKEALMAAQSQKALRLWGIKNKLELIPMAVLKIGPIDETDEKKAEEEPETPEEETSEEDLGTTEREPVKPSVTLDFDTVRKVTDDWREASETIDDQITKLKSALKGSNDPDLLRIAEYGLNAVTGNHKVPLLAALKDLAAVKEADRPKLAKRVCTVAKAFREHLATSDMVTVCDDNPFGVTVTIRKTLVPALDGIVKTLGG